MTYMCFQTTAHMMSELEHSSRKKRLERLRNNNQLDGTHREGSNHSLKAMVAILQVPIKVLVESQIDEVIKVSIYTKFASELRFFSPYSLFYVKH